MKILSEFARPFVVKNLLTMTEYDANFAFPVLFENEKLKNTLAEVVANAGLTQLHTAETEKYAHVTFFFNAGRVRSGAKRNGGRTGSDRGKFCKRRYGRAYRRI